MHINKISPFTIPGKTHTGPIPHEEYNLNIRLKVPEEFNLDINLYDHNIYQNNNSNLLYNRAKFILEWLE